MLKEDRLGQDKILKCILSLALPGVIAQLVNVLYSIVDRIYIGHIQTDANLALSAIGVSSPILQFVASFAFLIGLGGAPILSIALGAKDKIRADKVLSNAFILLILVAIILMIIIYPLAEILLKTFGATSNNFPYAIKYFKIYMIGTIFVILSQGLNIYIIAQGFGKTAMAMVLSGAILNIILDPVFIFILNMGIEGAAIASVISQAVAMILNLSFLLSRYCYVKIKIKKPDIKIIKKIIFLGISPFIIISTDSVIILILNKILSQYAGNNIDQIMTAATITLSFMQLVVMPLCGITGGTQPFLGYNYGAGKLKRVKIGIVYTFIIAIIFTIIMFILAQCASSIFVKIFTSDLEVIQLSKRFIKIYTVGIILMVIEFVIVDALTGLSFAHISIFLSLLRKIVLILTLTLTLPYVMGYEGVFWAESIGDILSAILGLIFFLPVIKRILRKREKELYNKF